MHTNTLTLTDTETHSRAHGGEGVGCIRGGVPGSRVLPRRRAGGHAPQREFELHVLHLELQLAGLGLGELDVQRCLGVLAVEALHTHAVSVNPGIQELKIGGR